MKQEEPQKQNCREEGRASMVGTGRSRASKDQAVGPEARAELGAQGSQGGPQGQMLLSSHQCGLASLLGPQTAVKTEAAHVLGEIFIISSFGHFPATCSHSWPPAILCSLNLHEQFPNSSPYGSA